MFTKDKISDQSGKTIIVTGANSGIGFETAFALFEKGANIILACRDETSAQTAIEYMKAQGGKGTLRLIQLDLSDLNNVNEFAAQISKVYPQIDVLINNAGVANLPATKTKQGFELQFGVNFLGHFALTCKLYGLLNKTDDSRIITVSSNGYQNATIDFHNLKSEKSYEALREYRQSKLANLIFAIELDRRIKIRGDKVLSIAAQPGANNTNLTRHVSQENLEAGKERLGKFMEPWQGALSILYASVSNEVKPGNLYEPEDNGLRGYPVQAYIRENASDETIGRKLWNYAEEVTSLKFL